MGRVIRYGEAFKLRVIEQIESGELTVAEARRVYDIACRGTIDNWLNRRGKQHLVPNVIRVTMKTEKDRIKELQRRNRKLEHALVEERLRILALESAIEVYEEETGLKKKGCRSRFVKKTLERAEVKGVKVSVSKVCRMFGISRQAYYKKSVKRGHDPEVETLLLEEIKDLRLDQPMIGGRKLFRETSARIYMGRDAFFSFLQRHGLLVKRSRTTVITTTAGTVRYPNLFAEVDLTGPGQALVCDITYIRTAKGFCYAALVTDAFSRMIVGYDLSVSLSADGALRALRMALSKLKDSRGTVHHSDRGCQYSSGGYLAQMMAAGMKISQTQRHHCAENALAERVNGILKHEFMLRATFDSDRQARRALARAVYIYNHKRPHLSLDYAKPAQVHAASMTGIQNTNLSTYSRT